MFKPIPNLSAKDLERFWSHVDKRGDDECWEWQAAKDKYGRGKFTLNHSTFLSNRLAYFISHGSIDDALGVLHTCDHPFCCNPRHLFQGTQLDNIRDMMRKGRQNFDNLHHYGNDHWTRKHPELLKRGDEHWSHLHPERAARGDKNGMRLHPERVLRGEQSGPAKLTNEQVKSIRSLRKDGLTYTVLSKMFKTSISNIQRIIVGVIWKDIP